MIPLPNTGFVRSVTVHRVELDALSDWIEGCALFGNESHLSASEVLETLIQEELYDKQEFCWARIDEALGELRRRSTLGAAFPLRIERRRIERMVGSWRDVPAHAFLLLLTLAQRYRKWRKVMPVDYNVQGELFEALTKESLQKQLPDWVIDPTGWSRTKPTKLHALVTRIASSLGEMQGDPKAWTKPQANEAGLDLLCYRPFPDRNVGIPLLMVQCASGHWDEPGKLKTPDLEVWTKVVLFASRPKRAFATPFCFLRNDFRQIANKIDGILLDRYRLLIPKDKESNWMSAELRSQLTEWGRQRIARLSELVD